MVVYVCDSCDQPIEGAIYRRDTSDLCGACIKTPELECPHEENISDEVPGRSTARLVCKACGYDREEAV